MKAPFLTRTAAFSTMKLTRFCVYIVRRSGYAGGTPKTRTEFNESICQWTGPSVSLTHACKLGNLRLSRGVKHHVNVGEETAKEHDGERNRK